MIIVKKTSKQRFPFFLKLQYGDHDNFHLGSYFICVNGEQNLITLNEFNNLKEIISSFKHELN